MKVRRKTGICLCCEKRVGATHSMGVACPCPQVIRILPWMNGLTVSKVVAKGRANLHQNFPHRFSEMMFYADQEKTQK